MRDLADSVAPEREDEDGGGCPVEAGREGWLGVGAGRQKVDAAVRTPDDAGGSLTAAGVTASIPATSAAGKSSTWQRTTAAV